MAAGAIAEAEVGACDRTGVSVGMLLPSIETVLASSSSLAEGRFRQGLR